ncbi:hypothetical protein PM8797T_25031, partial [Gimesia maris DSM 8797]
KTDITADAAPFFSQDHAAEPLRIAPTPRQTGTTVIEQSLM